MLLPVCVILILVSLKSASSSNCASCISKDWKQKQIQQNIGDSYSGNKLFKLLIKRMPDVFPILHTASTQTLNEVFDGPDEIKIGPLNPKLKKRTYDCKSKRWIYLPCLRKYNMGQLTAKQAKHYAKMMHVLFGIGK